MSAAGPRSVPADLSLPDGAGRNANLATEAVGIDPEPPVASTAAGGRAGMWLIERPVLAVVAVAVSTALAVMGTAIGVSAWQQRSGPPVEELLPIVAPVAPIPTATPIVVPVDHLVHIAGAVRDPGVVQVPEGSRVVDALEAAGGPAADADLDRLNLAAPVADGERVHVPIVGEESPSVVNGSGVGTAGSAAPTPGPVELNSATATELETLNGVGPATASAILDFRDRNGPFATVDALLDVPGIGPAKLENLRSQVVVNP